MGFYEELISYSPFFMTELAEKLYVKGGGLPKKIYKKIYMHVRVYHKDEWECKEEANGERGRSPLLCTYIGGKK